MEETELGVAYPITRQAPLWKSAESMTPISIFIVHAKWQNRSGYVRLTHTNMPFVYMTCPSKVSCIPVCMP